MKKVISFSVYGENPKYTLGLIRNLELIEKIYPEWITYVYYNNKENIIYFAYFLETKSRTGPIRSTNPVEENAQNQLSQDQDSKLAAPTSQPQSLYHYPHSGLNSPSK